MTYNEYEKRLLKKKKADLIKGFTSFLENFHVEENWIDDMYEFLFNQFEDYMRFEKRKDV